MNLREWNKLTEHDKICILYYNYINSYVRRGVKFGKL